MTVIYVNVAVVIMRKARSPGRRGLGLVVWVVELLRKLETCHATNHFTACVFSGSQLYDAGDMSIGADAVFTASISITEAVSSTPITPKSWNIYSRNRISVLSTVK